MPTPTEQAPTPDEQRIITGEVRKLLDTGLNTDRIYELVRNLPREGVDTPEDRALLNKIFDDPSVREIVRVVVDAFRGDIDNLAASAATVAFKAATRLNQPDVKEGLVSGAEKVAGAVGTAERGLVRYVEVVFPIAQRIMSGVIWVIDVVLRFSVPILSLVIGYSLKVLGPLVIAAVAASPLALLSDRRYKVIADLDAEVSRMVVDRMLRSKVSVFQYVKGAGPPGTFIGAMADDLPRLVGDGHMISVPSYLGALTLVAQRQQTQLDDQSRQLDSALASLQAIRAALSEL